MMMLDGVAATDASEMIADLVTKSSHFWSVNSVEMMTGASDDRFRVSLDGDQLHGCKSSMSCGQMEFAVVAGTKIPPAISSLPFVSSVLLKRLLNPRPVTCVIKAYVSSMGTLCINEHLDWIPMIRVARNCHEQNLIAHLTHNSSAIILQTTRELEIGEELKVWLSIDLMVHLRVPFLSPKNIVNDHCYQCHLCGATFCQPNPLKIHLTLVCPPAQELTTSFVPGINLSRIQTPELASSTSSRIEDLNEEESEPKDKHQQRTHTCLFCGKMYTRKYGLKIHVRTHTGQKPLRCRFCGRAFSDPSNLNKHVRLHCQNEHQSPYKCRICGKILVRRRDLQRHLKSRHQH